MMDGNTTIVKKIIYTQFIIVRTVIKELSKMNKKDLKDFMNFLHYMGYTKYDRSGGERDRSDYEDLVDYYLDKSETYYFKDNTDEELLESYMWGFDDELGGVFRVWEPSKQMLRVYELGRTDAIIGDDIPSHDLQTNEQILKRIRNE